ncbi:MAG: glycoside hydrolase family 57 protein [Candidatus Aenigmatarchaeota archaeon]
MTSICLYFKVHQPWRLKHHSSLQSAEVTKDSLHEHYFEKHSKDKEIFERVAKKCYRPANDVLLEAMEESEERGIDFKVSFSLTGTFIEQCREYDPEVLQSFRELANTRNVEILGETYFHSLASLFEEMDEFKTQVKMHREVIEDEFGVTPKMFSNTEALYNNRIAKTVEDLGFKGVLTEGADRVLGWRSPNYVYRAPENVADLPILTKNYRLSDDIAFRFSAKWWDEWPLTADKFASWLSAADGDVVNLFMDYETFGEHHWADSGIFSFLRHLPRDVIRRDDLRFRTPSEVVESHEPKDELDVFEYDSISWADEERDETAWLGNWMQKFLFKEIKMLEPFVKRTEDEELIDIWRKLQTSDHLYYLSKKGFGDGDVHSYFSSFNSPEDTFRSFVEVIKDFKERVLEEI